MPDPISSLTPQFGTAELAGTDVCKFCKKVITGVYYRVNTLMACGSCAEQARRRVRKDSHGAYTRALLLGASAAFVGFVLYAGFAIITGWMIGYVSLAVGFLVGKGMLIGSKGVGGRRYQITAILLTYFAVSMAAVPIALYFGAKQRHSQSTTTTQSRSEQDSGASQIQGETGGANASTSGTPAHKSIGLVAAFSALILIGLSSPFQELFASPGNGLLGAIILFVGLRIAWKMTQGARLSVDGPFESTTPPSVAANAGRG